MAERKKQRDARIKRARKTSSSLCHKLDRVRRALGALAAKVAASQHGEEFAAEVSDARAALDETL